MQAQFAYDGSIFNDNNKALDWQNPFEDPARPTDFGQLENPPDNEYHKVSTTVGYDVAEHTRLTGQLAFGRMSQNSNFLPHTINPTLPTSPLPATDLNGKVDTKLAKLGVPSRPTRKLRLNADYTYSDRDNRTNQNFYEYVIIDLVISPVPRENRPYSFKQHLLRANVGYTLPMRPDISVGLDYDKTDRTFQEVDHRKDSTAWAELKVKPHDLVEACRMRYR